NLLDAFARTHSVEVVFRAAASDLVLRRRLIKFLFYWGVAKRAKGEEEGCLELMEQCANLENPIVEDEWYLARDEAATSRSSGGQTGAGSNVFGFLKRSN